MLVFRPDIVRLHSFLNVKTGWYICFLHTLKLTVTRTLTCGLPGLQSYKIGVSFRVFSLKLRYYVCLVTLHWLGQNMPHHIRIQCFIVTSMFWLCIQSSIHHCDGNSFFHCLSLVLHNKLTATARGLYKEEQAGLNCFHDIYVSTH